MSMTITYAWSGGNTPLRQFIVMDVVKTWADTVNPQVVQALKDKTPVYKAPAADPHPRPGGTLKKKTRSKRTYSANTLTSAFNSYTPYTRYVLDGTSAHEIVPVAARSLRYYDNIGVNFAKRVWHPGTHANNYPAQVLEEMRDHLSSSLADMLAEAMGS